MPVQRAANLNYTLLSNASATGSSVVIEGGEYVLFAEGTLTGATLSLDIKSPNGTWIAVEELAGNKVATTTLPRCITWINLPAGEVRATKTGGTASGLYVYLVGLG